MHIWAQHYVHYVHKRIVSLTARQAFTLVELIVVVVVLGILLAIAMPSFFGATKSTQDAGAKTYLTTAFTDLRVCAQQNGHSYGTPAQMAACIQAAEPELTAGESTCLNANTLASKSTGVDPHSTPNAVTLYAHSDSGSNWQLWADQSSAPVITPVSCGVARVLLSQDSASGIDPVDVQWAGNSTLVFIAPVSSTMGYLEAMAVGSGSVTKLVSTPIAYNETPGTILHVFAVSPDGQTVAYISLTYFNYFYTVPISGGTPTLIGRGADPYAVGPVWSADGQDIAAGDEYWGGVSSYAANGSDATNFGETALGVSPGSAPIGFANGRFYLVSVTDQWGDANYYTVKPDGSDLTALSVHPHYDMTAHALWVSSDGGTVATEIPGTGNLELTRLANGDVTTFALPDARYWAQALSADWTEAFAAYNDNGTNSFVIPFSADSGFGTPAAVQSCSGPAAFSPDGTQLACLNVDGTGYQLIVIPLS